MKKVYTYFVWIFLFVIVLVSFSKGIYYLFSSIQIFAQSLFILIAINLLGIWTLKSGKSSAIIKGGFVWKIKNNRIYKIYALVFLGIIQLGILGFAYSPLGNEYNKLMVFAIIIPSLLSSAFLIKE